MVSNEEKIKAFFDDEEKVKALANDKEFIESVAGGIATPETYKNEFQKLGLSLTPQEAEQVATDTKKVLSMPVEKLEKIEEDCLANISGGKPTMVRRASPEGITSLVLGVSGVGTLIAGVVCKMKGNDKVANTLFGISAGLGIGSVVFDKLKDQKQINEYKKYVQDVEAENSKK